MTNVRAGLSISLGKAVGDGRAAHSLEEKLSHLHSEPHPTKQSGLTAAIQRRGKRTHCTAQQPLLTMEGGGFKGSSSPEFSGIAAGSGLYKLYSTACLIRYEK